MIKTKIGTTFAAGYCRYLGLDPKKTLDEIIKLDLNPVRIGIYWEEVETKPGEFNFSNFDWITEKLTEAKIDIILAIGAKTPRWPEFHLPDFIKKKYDFKEKEKINSLSFFQDVRLYLKTILNHYKNILAIKYIQVENEPFEPFGPDKWTIHPDFLAKEIDLVKTLTKKPLICTNGGMDPVPVWLASLNGKYQRLETCLAQNVDYIGLDVYPVIPQEVLGKFYYFRTNQSHWNKLAQIKKQIESSGKKAWITELQAEPWEPEPMDTKNHLGNSSCNPELVKDYLKKAQEIGFEVILLWGAEFWLACVKDKNSTWLKIIKS